MVWEYDIIFWFPAPQIALIISLEIFHELLSLRNVSHTYHPMSIYHHYMDYEDNVWPENMPLLYLAAQLARLNDLISYDELLDALMIFSIL